MAAVTLFAYVAATLVVALALLAGVVHLERLTRPAPIAQAEQRSAQTPDTAAPRLALMRAA